jgi:hypothetical protein
MEVLFNADEFEASGDVRGIELASASGDTVVLVGSEDDILGLLRRVADNLGEQGATVEWRDPGPAEDDIDIACRAFGLSRPNATRGWH